MESIVLKHLRDKVQSVLDSISNSPEQQAEHKAQIAQLESAKRTLYERFVLREISGDEFKSENFALDAELDRAKLVKAAVKGRATKNESISKVRTIAENALVADTLSQTVVETFIDRVCVYPGNRVEIVWCGVATGA